MKLVTLFMAIAAIYVSASFADIDFKGVQYIDRLQLVLNSNSIKHVDLEHNTNVFVNSWLYLVLENKSADMQVGYVARGATSYNWEPATNIRYIRVQLSKGASPEALLFFTECIRRLHALKEKAGTKPVTSITLELLNGTNGMAYSGSYSPNGGKVMWIDYDTTVGYANCR